jgi:hypothetical protein
MPGVVRPMFFWSTPIFTVSALKDLEHGASPTES